MKNSILGKARWLREVALATSKNNGARVAREWLKYAAMFVMLFTIGIGNVWGADAQCTLSNTNIVNGGAAANSYGPKKMTDGCSQTWNAYAIKNQHSKRTSSYHFLQIKAYSSSTAYYVQVPEKTGYTIKSITMVVSSTNQPQTGGGNNATLFFSASNSTSSAGSGVASGTGSSSVTINCSSLSLTTGYITASAAVRIWGDIVVTYTPSGAPSKVSTPTFSVAAGTYTGSQSVTLSCTTTGATIHYTTDGTTPTSSSPTYSSAITVDVTQTIKAIAIKDGMTNSDVAEAAYTIKCATPTFSPAAGTYGAVQSVSISTTYGTNIYYTTDGTTPTTSSTPYTSAISVSSTQTIKAIASKSGCSDSDEGSAAYTINIPYTVSFNTGTGNPTQADITEASAGAGITLPDGPTPACSDDGWVFVGWAESSCSETTTAPELLAAGDEITPESDMTLYAVYRKLTSGTSTATFNAADISNLTTHSTYNRDWRDNTGGIELYISDGQYYTGGSPKTWTVTKGASNYALVDAHTKISSISITISGNNYKVGSVDKDAGTADLSTSGTSQTVTCSGDVTQVYLRAMSNYQIRMTTFTVTYYNAKFDSNPTCCTNNVPAPTVIATNTAYTVTLTWAAVDGATGYEVSWNGGAFEAATSPCVKSGLTASTDYIYKVRATYDPLVKCGALVASGNVTTDDVYSVTYSGGTGTGSCSPSGSVAPVSYEAGATVTLAATNSFSLTSNTFAAWVVKDAENNDVAVSNNQFTMPASNVTVTATWTAVQDKYYDRMHQSTDASHGGIADGNGKYYIVREGCNYTVPSPADDSTGDTDCHTTHFKSLGWIAQSHLKSDGSIKDGEESYIFQGGTIKSATGATYYAVYAIMTE